MGFKGLGRALDEASTGFTEGFLQTYIPRIERQEKEDSDIARDAISQRKEEANARKAQQAEDKKIKSTAIAIAKSISNAPQGTAKLAYDFLKMGLTQADTLLKLENAKANNQLVSSSGELTPSDGTYNLPSFTSSVPSSSSANEQYITTGVAEEGLSARTKLAADFLGVNQTARNKKINQKVNAAAPLEKTQSQISTEENKKPTPTLSIDPKINTYVDLPELTEFTVEGLQKWTTRISNNQRVLNGESLEEVYGKNVQTAITNTSNAVNTIVKKEELKAKYGGLDINGILELSQGENGIQNLQMASEYFKDSTNSRDIEIKKTIDKQLTALISIKNNTNTEEKIDKQLTDILTSGVKLVDKEALFTHLNTENMFEKLTSRQLNQLSLLKINIEKTKEDIEKKEKKEKEIKKEDLLASKSGKELSEALLKLSPPFIALSSEEKMKKLAEHSAKYDEIVLTNTYEKPKSLEEYLQLIDGENITYEIVISLAKDAGLSEEKLLLLESARTSYNESKETTPEKILSSLTNLVDVRNYITLLESGSIEMSEDIIAKTLPLLKAREQEFLKFQGASDQKEYADKVQQLTTPEEIDNAVILNRADRTITETIRIQRQDILISVSGSIRERLAKEESKIKNWYSDFTQVNSNNYKSAILSAMAAGDANMEAVIRATFAPEETNILNDPTQWTKKNIAGILVAARGIPNEGDDVEFVTVKGVNGEDLEITKQAFVLNQIDDWMSNPLNMSSQERAINTLVTLGVDAERAKDVVYNLEKFIIDPSTGLKYQYNKETGELKRIAVDMSSIFTNAGGITEEELNTNNDFIEGSGASLLSDTDNLTQTQETYASFPSIDPTKVLGIKGWWKGVRTKTADFFGFQSGTDRQALDTASFVNILKTDTLTQLQTALPGKESKWLAQQYKALTIDPFGATGLQGAAANIQVLTSYLESIEKSKLREKKMTPLYKDRLELERTILSVRKLRMGWTHFLNAINRTAGDSLLRTETKTDIFENSTLVERPQ